MKSLHVINKIAALILVAIFHALFAGYSAPTMADVAALYAIVAAFEASDAADIAERIFKDMP